MADDPTKTPLLVLLDEDTQSAVGPNRSDPPESRPAPPKPDDNSADKVREDLKNK